MIGGADVPVIQTMQIPLGKLSEVTAGPSGSLLDNLHDGPDGVPVISPSDLTEDHKVDARRVRHVPWADAKKLARFALQEGDLLVVRQGALGRLALISAEQATWFYSSSCLRVRPQPERVLSAYLVSYLSYPPVRKRLLGHALPGTVPSLNSAMLNELPIIVPPIGQQQAVIEALADIDAQIELQRAIAERLNALRSAIFGEMIQESRRA